MGQNQFKATIDNLNLDDKTRRKLQALGPQFMQYVSDLLAGNSSDTRMQLRDLADRVGGEVAEALVASFNDAESEAIASAFIQANRDYFVSDANYRTLLDHLSNIYLHVDSSQIDDNTLIEDLLVRGFLTVENLTAAFHDLNKAGLMEQPKGKAKPLTLDEQQSLSLSCAALANMPRGSQEYADHLERCLTAYLRYALPDENVRSWRSLIGKSQYFSVMTDAIFWVWQSYRADYEPSQGAEGYIKRYLSGRAATVPLLDAAWDRCVKETGGRGLITEAEAIVDEEQELADASIADIDARFTVRK